MCDADAWRVNRYDARPTSWPRSGAADGSFAGGHYYYTDFSTWVVGDHGEYVDNTTEASDATFTPAYAVEESRLHAGGVTLSAAVAEDKCFTKCSAGCIGAHCFCDGLLDADDAASDALCLSPAKCRDACNALAGAGCRAYSMSKDSNRCYLSDATTYAYSSTFDYWQMKYDGTNPAKLPCQSLADFLAVKKAGADWSQRMEVKKNIGTLYVTQKVTVGVDYIATPKEPTSLEVTGTGLDWTSDRVMVIDCFGTCGVTSGSSYAMTPGGNFNEWVAVNAMVDRPSMREMPKKSGLPTTTWTPFKKSEKQYCPGNMMLAKGSLADNHKCYKKCYAEAPCNDGTTDGSEACFCDGFISGFDDEDSQALCISQNQCEYLCSVTPGCHSVDMHKSKDRCYLNTAYCGDYIRNSQTVPNNDYDLLVKPMDDNTRRMQERGRQLQSSHVRQLLSREDPGVSWGEMLRFKDLQFSSGGEFKLCFCDSALLTGANAVCNGPEDYTIEVGKIHATGLQCLLSNPKMTRGTCVKQHYDGLRCYDGAAPTTTLPVEFMGVPNPDGSDWTAQTEMLISFCQHATDEMAAEFEFCDQWRRDGAWYMAQVAMYCPMDCAADEMEQQAHGGTVPICEARQDKYGTTCKHTGCTAFLRSWTGFATSEYEEIAEACDPGTDAPANP